MIIVGGTFEVAPDEREQFLADRLDAMRSSRGEAGCLEYTFCADPLEPGRVVLFERWETQAHLDVHLATLRSGAPAAGGVAPQSVSVVFYDAEPQPAPGS
jgi:quinol monooxygenase YgiN